jgi:hypothetical protein
LPVVSIGGCEFFLDVDYTEKVELIDNEKDLLYKKYSYLSSHHQTHHLSSHLRKILELNGWERSED